MEANLAGFLLMRRISSIRVWCLAAVCALLCVAVAASAAETAAPKAPAKTPAKASTAKPSTHKTKHSRTKTKSRSSKKKGQKAIDAERTQQIQEALIREHYLKGEASGKWDDATQAALRRYQAEQGWQSKSVPDSRALIKLGLGPNHDHLLNPETAMTTAPAANPKSKPQAADPVKPTTSSAPATAVVPQK